MKVTIETPDLVVGWLVRQFEKRSQAAAEEFQNDSILDSGLTEVELLDNAIEEVMDQLVYLAALRSRFTTPRG